MEVQVFRKFDAGGHIHENGRHVLRDDCTVRALSVTTGMDYLDAWELLYRVQHERTACMFRLFEWLREEPNTFHVKRYWAFPARRGVPRMKLRDFQRNYPNGCFIVQIAHHATAVIDGVVLDTWYPGRKTIYGAWEMER